MSRVDTTIIVGCLGALLLLLGLATLFLILGYSLSNLPEEPEYALLEARYTALETRFGVLERRPEGCITALQRPLGDAGDARDERVSRVDTVPLDASRAPRDPLAAGGYKWGTRVVLDLETPERNPR